MHKAIQPHICISTRDPKNRKSLDKYAVICHGHVLMRLSNPRQNREQMSTTQGNFNIYQLIVLDY